MFWTILEALAAFFIGLPILIFILKLLGSAIVTPHRDDH